jgi:stage V sporulation protein SpoVS
VWLRPARPRRRTAPKENLSARSALLSWPAALCAPLLIIAPVVAYTSTIEVSHSLTYWLVAIEALGCWALWRCDRHLQLSCKESTALPDWNWWLAACLTPAAALLAASPLIWGLGRGAANFSVDEAAVIALGFDANSGIAFFLVPAVAALAVMCTSAALATGGVIAERNLEVLMGASAHAPVSSRRLPVTRALLPAMVMIALIILLALPGLLDFLGGARLTIFDPYASAMAVFALAATTLCAGVLLCAAVGAARRIRKMCGYVRGRILECSARAAGASASQAPGLWSGSAEMPVTFAATPVLARSGGGGASGARLAALDAKTWAAALARLWGQEPAADADRLALFMLLAAEMTLFRWAAAGTVVGTLASVIIVYLYPVEADPLLLLNLVILVAIGLYSAYVTAGFERDEVLSNVLCNRPKKVQVSVAFFSFIAAPFIALAAAIMIVAIPGVVDWAGGVLAMARALGVHP